jgi:hypothetical protein
MLQNIQIVNDYINRLFSFFNKCKITDILKFFLITGFVAGFILGIVSGIERISFYGSGLSFTDKLLTFIFSMSILSLAGLFLALVEFLIFETLLQLFLKLSCHTGKNKPPRPHLIIILFQLVIAGLLTFFYTDIFLYPSSEFDYFLTTFSPFFSGLFIALFVLFSAITIFFVLYLIRQPDLEINKEVIFKKYRWYIIIIAIPITVLFFLYLLSIISNSWVLSEWMPPALIEFINFFNIKLFSTLPSSDLLFIISLFVTLSVIFVFLNYLFLYMTQKYIDKKLLHIAGGCIFFALCSFMYILAQNFFTNQLFFKYKITLSITLFCLFCFVFLHITVMLAYSPLKRLMPDTFLSKKVLIPALILYSLFLIIGLTAFNNNQVIRAFILRHNTFKKLTLCMPLFLIGKQNLEIIKIKSSHLAFERKLHLDKTGLNRPDIIFIIVDTLRADAVEKSFHDKENILSKFKEHAYYFNNCYSHTTYTTSSIASTYTSRFLATRADTQFVSLPDILSHIKYYTYSITNFHKVYNFDKVVFNNKSYDSIFNKGITLSDKTVIKQFRKLEDGAITLRFKAFLEQYTHEQPIFAHIHYVGLHMIAGTELINNLFNSKHFKNVYTDRMQVQFSHLEDLFQILKKNKRYNNALIILTSDHGEAAKEHGNLFHVFGLYQENIHIPLFIKLPGQTENKTFDQPVSSLDIVPTILDYINLPAQHFHFDGSSLMPLIENRTIKTGPVYSAVYLIPDSTCKDFSIYGDFDHYDKTLIEVALIDENNEWKLIYNSFFDFKELYNLKEDPHERNNQIMTRKQIAAQMLQKIHNTLFLKK